MCPCGCICDQQLMDGKHGEYRPLVLNAKLQIVRHFPDGIGMGSYDNACGEIKWEEKGIAKAVELSLVTREEAAKLRVINFVPKFHAPAHCPLCQMEHGQMHVVGAGYQDHEILEKYHDQIGGMRSRVRHSSVLTYQNAMNRFNMRHADDVNRNFPVHAVRRVAHLLETRNDVRLRLASTPAWKSLACGFPHELSRGRPALVTEWSNESIRVLQVCGSVCVLCVVCLCFCAGGWAASQNAGKLESDTVEYLELLYKQQLHDALRTPVVRFPGLRSQDARREEEARQAGAYTEAMSALFHSKFESALLKTTQALSDEVNKNKQRYQLLLLKFNGNVSTEMRKQFAQYKALELCHSLDTLVAQVTRDGKFSESKKKGARAGALCIQVFV